LIHNSSFRDREQYTRTLLKDAQDRRQVRLAQEWNSMNKGNKEKAISRDKAWQGNLLFKPVLRLAQFILILLSI
jgi:hypothetical protein